MSSVRSNRIRNFKPRGSVGSWFAIKNITTDTASMAIYDEIGAWGVTASDFVNELNSVAAKRINLSISSPGGDVFDGLAILNALRQHPATVEVTIDGLAASAASFIAMAGDTIRIAPQAMVMIHDASGVVIGNAEDMLDMADLLDKTSDNIAAVYAQRAGGTVEDWRAAMKAETWYSDQEAVDAGLADEILSSGTSDAAPTNAAPVAVQALAEPTTPVSWDDLDLDPETIRQALKGA
ncbi:head maturation protease, ClpP-related [Streptomyces pseudogriseolus]|uniref:head maturation protease, ClpP-related n=1 Tax=Streptomyces pseudogriseolus TaxID=36817 RepID=UPI003FA32B7F